MFVAFGTFLAVNFDLLVSFLRLFINKYEIAAIGSIPLYIMLVIGFFLLLRLFYKRKFPIDTIAKILAVTFSGLVLFNVVMAFIGMGRIAASAEAIALNTENVPAPTPNATPATGTPNVYFFVMDEYSSFDILSKYYGYDNRVFNDFLNAEGFSVSRASYATDDETEQCRCDLLNLNYISRHLSKSACLNASTPLYTIFSNLGYTQAQLSTNNIFFNGIPSLDPTIKPDASDVTMDGEEAGDIVSDNSITDAFSALLTSDADSDTKVDTGALNQWGVYPSDYIRNSKEYKNNSLHKDADNLLTIFDYFENPSNYAASAPHVTYFLSDDSACALFIQPIRRHKLSPPEN